MPLKALSVRQSWKNLLRVWLVCFWVSACTMPLPMDPSPSDAPSPDNTTGETNPLPIGQIPLIPLEQILLNQAWYQETSIRYLDLLPCSNSESSCTSLGTPLSPLLRYEFFFSDGSPVLGQNPVFNAPGPNENSSPFRRVIRVIVPDGYQPNTIRSSQDVLASQFRTEDTARVLNNPLISQQNPNSPLFFPLTRGEAWLENETKAYLELETVPYSANRNQLGVGVVYFMRNQDKTDLPSHPRPIFDTRPGDLLYSPIRQVFRAIAENQADSVANDPSVSIRSQDQLLDAVNQGLFRLEDTQEFFDYPVYRDLQTSSEDEFQMRLLNVAHFPALPEGSFYVLWVIDQLNQARQILRFRGEGSQLSLPDGSRLSTGSDSAEVFRFSRSEINTFRYFLVSIESEDVSEPTGSTLLRALYESREQTRLQVPFKATYSALQEGFYMLVAPSARNQNLDHSGLWFIQRDDPSKDLTETPRSQELSPGLILSLPPKGWVYNGWILSDLRNPYWLQTGRFRAINQADQAQRYGLTPDAPYPFPGEDFLQNPPSDLVFPLNLPSTGERQLVVSLEPENLNLSKPFFSLFQTVILRSTPVLKEQPLPFTPVAFPSLDIQLIKK